MGKKAIAWNMGLNFISSRKDAKYRKARKAVIRRLLVFITIPLQAA